MRVGITGITGTLGTEVLKRLIDKGHTIHGLTRCEHKFKKYDSNQIRMFLGGIMDMPVLKEFSHGIDTLFHFAALKHIDLMETQISECIKTNLLGTLNIQKVQKLNNIKRVVFTSTDKAVYPVNVYGMCKAISEKIIAENTNNVICRYGNVLASNGSVLHLFKDQILKGQKITITDKEMTRFWITKSQAAEFVIEKALGKPGLYVPNMKGFNIKKLGRLTAEVLGKDYSGYVEIGKRRGEKTHECLHTEFEGGKDCFSNEDEFTRREVLELIAEVI